MITKQRSLYISALITDSVLIVVSFLLSAAIAQSFAILLQHVYMFVLLPLLLFVWYFSTASGSFYKDIGSRFYLEQAFQTLRNIALQSVMIVLYIFLVKELLFQRNFLILNAVFLTSFILLRIIVFRKALKRYRDNTKHTRMLLVIGNRKSAENFVQDIRDITALGYSRIEIFSITPDSSQPFEQTLDELQQYIEQNDISEAIIAPSSLSEVEILKVIKICNVYALHTFLLPDFLSLLSRKFSIATVGHYPLIALRTEPLEDIHMQALKRVFDLSLTLVFFLVLGWWIFPLLFLSQKLLNPGPVLYIQKRVGRNNKVFACYKLRSMSISYSDPTSYVPTMKNDLRVTRFGQFLRKVNLDELPQFFNVLKGDMSLVGPRPHAVSFEEKYKEFVDEIKLRHLVKPGITGWAQIHGLRGDISDPELNRLHISKRIQFDIWYVENWSFSLDLKILFITLWQMIGSKNLGN